MSHTPAQQWSELSALYEEADGLPAHQLGAWLERLEREAHPLLPQLKRMLEARERMATDEFLETMPRLVSGEDRRSDWSAGRRVGPYRLVRPLGEGGMAEVWLAERDDGAFKRQVAIKLPYPRPGRETFAVRFDRERDILASLRHPNIAGLFDAGVTPDGQAWLALEYVEGQPISTFCDERRLSVRDRVLLFRQVLLAVQHAHANLVIHRDLKPGNILVTPQGEVRLLDFGIAKLLEAQGDAIEETELTRQAGRSLTPRYASPEQLMGVPLTTACDVYSLGVVFYELTCGERPYELRVESPAQLEHAILEMEPRAMSRRVLTETYAEARGTQVKLLKRALAPELDAIALRCLAKKPSARYSSVDAVLGDIDRWLAGEAVLARAPSAWYRMRKFTARHRFGVVLGSAAIVALIATAAVAVVMGLQARVESARAGAARDFMLSLFQRADQEKARGADITARELLETGRKDVITRLVDQPRLQVELLNGIASIQKEMGEYVGADGTFADAARIYLQLGMPREAALALTSQADSAVRMGNMKLAKEVLLRAKAVPGRPSDDPESNARIAEVEGWIAFANRELSVARDLFKRSHEQALRAFGPYHLKTIDTLRGLFYAERELRHFDTAMQLLSELDEAGTKTSGVGAVGVAAVARDRVDLLVSTGDWALALEEADKSASKCNVELGPNHAECRELTFRKVQSMLRLGMTGATTEDRQALVAMAADERSPALGVDSLLLMLRLDSASQSSELTTSFERVRALVESDAVNAYGPSFKARVLLTLAECRMRANDMDEAQRWVDKALSLYESNQALGTKAPVIALATSLRGTVALERGALEAAVQDLRSAKEASARLLGQHDPTTLLLSLNLAAGLERLGRLQDALDIVNASVPRLLRSMGPKAPTYLRAVELGARLNQAAVSRHGDSAAATAGRDKGRQLRVDFFS